MCRHGACACWLLMVELHITDMHAADRHGQEAEACTALRSTPAHKCSKVLMWSVVRNSSSKAR